MFLFGCSLQQLENTKNKKIEIFLGIGEISPELT